MHILGIFLKELILMENKNDNKIKSLDDTEHTKKTWLFNHKKILFDYQLFLFRELILLQNGKVNKDLF